MNELEQKIIDNITKAGGATDWDGVIEGLEHRDARSAYKTIRNLSKAGKVKREAKFVPNEGVSVTYSLVAEVATIESGE